MRVFLINNRNLIFNQIKHALISENDHCSNEGRRLITNVVFLDIRPLNNNIFLFK